MINNLNKQKKAGSTPCLEYIRIKNWKNYLQVFNLKGLRHSLK